ncbi:MAG: 8-oxo-dGTP diphosphatase MutT [Bacillota bacterium]|nr:8-oxo-dGTP diphosphatase MutT [Bacillota bacterium]
MTDVTVAIITNDQDQMLIAKRKKGKVMAGCWEFPGGKIESGETPEESLMRELKEEMNITISVGECITEITYDYEWGPVRLIAYQASVREGEIQLLDHDEIAWVYPVDMHRFGMTPADEPLIKDLAVWIKGRSK